MILLSLSSGKKLSAGIAKTLAITESAISISHFRDGEILVEPQVSVRGQNVYIIQSTCYPVNDNLMELLICIDACKRAGANEITAIIPYFGYARQDRKTGPRQPVTARLVANLIERAGATRVVAIDLHASQIEGFFDIPVDNIPALPIIASEIMKSSLSDITIVSPDHGGAKRAYNLASILDCPLAIIDKRRPKANEVAIINVVGNIKDRNCIMIDDMIDTGGTLLKGAEALLNMGAASISCACTHALLNGDAVSKFENSPVKKLIITDTIDCSEKTATMTKLQLVSIAPLLAHVISRIEHGKSVSDITNI